MPVWLCGAQEGTSLGCWYPGCCALFLLPLLWGHKLHNRESPPSCLAACFFLLSTEADLPWDEEWACKNLLCLDRDCAIPIVPQSQALTRCWPSFSYSLAMNCFGTCRIVCLAPPCIALCTPDLQHLGSPGLWTLRGFLLKGALVQFLQPYWSVTVGGAFASAACIPCFALQWHYEVTSLIGNPPWFQIVFQSGVPSLAHPGIADP